MSRTVNTKVLENTRLAANYGGWVYCTQCNENIGYLCYATYDKVDFHYTCNCGSHGSILIDFADSANGKSCDDALITIKNRLCCPADQSPLMTILSKKLSAYSLAITCKACGNLYRQTEK